MVHRSSTTGSKLRVPTHARGRCVGSHQRRPRRPRALRLPGFLGRHPGRFCDTGAPASQQGLGLDDASGPSGFAVYSSLDGFSQALIGASLAGQVLNHGYDYDAGLTASNLSGPLELRIVSTGCDARPAWAWLLDNLRLDVTLTQNNTVPESGSLPSLAIAP